MDECVVWFKTAVMWARNSYSCNGHGRVGGQVGLASTYRRV